MSCKMFVSDLDGTLLDNDHKISNENIEAIQALEEKSIKFIVATGRTKYMLEDYLDSVNYEGPFIWSNGAAISDTTGKVLLSKKLAVEDSKQLMDLAHEYKVDFVVYTLDGIVAEEEKGRMERLARYNESVKKEHRIPLTIDPMLYDNLHNYPVIKFSFSSKDSEALHQFQGVVNEKVEAINGVFSHPILLDVTRKDATKGEAVLELAKHYKIDPKEIAAIGDNQNDVSMLEVCGISITLENAVESAKQVAKHITKDNHSSGVAHAIKEYIL